jgi:uncharacterized oxidoreductase
VPAQAATGPRRFHNGMLSIYLAPSFFGSVEEFDAAAASYIDYVKSAIPAEPGGEVLVPGEPEERNRAERRARGVPMPRAAWDSILEVARGLGVAPPA